MTEIVAQPSTTAPPPTDLLSIVEAKVAAVKQPSAAAAVEAPAAPAGAAQEPAKPSAEPKASDVYARALEADRKAQKARQEAKTERDAIAAEKAAVEALRKQHESELAEAKEIIRLLTDDPRALLSKTKETPEAFVKRLATGQRTDPAVRELQERLDREAKARDDERAAAQAEAQKREEEARTQAEAAVMDNFVTVSKGRPEWGAASWLLESDPTTAKGVFQSAVEAHHAATGKLPTFEEALSKVQEALVADFQRMLSVPAFSDVARTVLGVGAAPANAAKPSSPAGQANAANPSPDVPRTITADHTTAAGGAPDPDEDDLTPAERLDRMTARLEQRPWKRNRQ